MLGTQQEKTRYYLKPVDGKFSVYTNQDGKHDPVDTVEGKLGKLTIVLDKGTPAGNGHVEIKPYNALLVFILDEEKNEEYVIKAKENIAFTRSLIKQLMNIEENDPIKISVRTGDRNNKVSLVSVQKYFPEEEKYKYFPTDIKDDADVFELIKEHSAFKAVKEAE